MTTQYQAVLFFVFIGFFVLIGLVSLTVLLGYPKSADPRLRQWAIPGFLVAVTTAVVALFKYSFTSVTVAPIVVTLVAPSGAVTPSPLKSGAWEYDQVGQDKVKIVTHS